MRRSRNPFDLRPVDWHAAGKPDPRKIRYIREFCMFWMVVGLMCITMGIAVDASIFLLIGGGLSGGALAILIQWELIKKRYAKNYKKNLRQWKKTRKH